MRKANDENLNVFCKLFFLKNEKKKRIPLISDSVKKRLDLRFVLNYTSYRIVICFVLCDTQLNLGILSHLNIDVCFFFSNF